MSRKMFKLVGLMVAVMMLTSVLSGCGESKQNKEEETTTVVETTQVPVDQGFVPEKELSLTLWDTQGTDMQAMEKPNEDLPGDWLFNKTKVRVTEIYGNGGQQWDAKLTTLVAGDNLPNILYTAAGQGPAHHAKLHEGDLNWELTPEMLQKYAPDVWSFVPQYIWDSIKIDGKIYGIPFLFPMDREVDPTLSDDIITAFSEPLQKITWHQTSSGEGLYVRDDILKKIIPSAMNYDEITKLIEEKNAPIGDSFILPIKSTDEYVKFMYDVKNLGLKEGNKPVYAFGYNGGDNWMALTMLGAEMMGYKNYFYTGWLNVNQKKMSFGYLEAAYKEAASVQNKMIREKVIDPESLVHNSEAFKEKVMNGQYAICAGSYIGTFDQLNKQLEEAGKEFRFVPFFTQVPNRPEYPYYKEGPPTFGSAYSILKTVKEDELPQVLNWINVQFTDEWDDIRTWGPKDADLYEELSDGTRKFKDEKMHKLIVEGDLNSMDWKDAKGLLSNNAAYSTNAPAGFESISKWLQGSKFNPTFLNKLMRYDTLQKAIKFPASSEWTKGFVPVPNIQSWSAEYANIPEVQALWSTRATWDDPFKVTLTAKSEEDFNKKWDAAIENFKKTIDVDKMLNEQTKIVLPLLEKRSAQAK